MSQRIVRTWMSKWCAISTFTLWQPQLFWQSELNAPLLNVDFTSSISFDAPQSSDKSWTLNYNFVLKNEIKSAIKLNRRGRKRSSTIIKLNCVDSIGTFPKPVFGTYQENDEFLIDLLLLLANVWFPLMDLELINWRFVNLVLRSTNNGPLVKLDPEN